MAEAKAEVERVKAEAAVAAAKAEGAVALCPGGGGDGASPGASRTPLGKGEPSGGEPGRGGGPALPRPHPPAVPRKVGPVEAARGMRRHSAGRRRAAAQQRGAEEDRAGGVEGPGWGQLQRGVELLHGRLPRGGGREGTPHLAGGRRPATPAPRNAG